MNHITHRLGRIVGGKSKKNSNFIGYKTKHCEAPLPQCSESIQYGKEQVFEALHIILAINVDCIFLLHGHAEAFKVIQVGYKMIIGKSKDQSNSTDSHTEKCIRHMLVCTVIAYWLNMKQSVVLKLQHFSLPYTSTWVINNIISIVILLLL